MEATGMIVRMIGALAIILGLMALVAWYVRRYAPGLKPGDPSSIEIEATRMVAPKHYISLVRVKDRELVVGIWDQGMVMLTELAAEKRDFSALLQKEAGSAESTRGGMGDEKGA